MKPIIDVQNLSKLYKLGSIGSTTVRESVENWWRRVRGVRDPYNVQKAKDVRIVPSRMGPRPNTFWSLKDISFQVETGEVVGIIGRNGAGKSTLLKILSRITEPTGGRAILRGRVASLLEVGTGFNGELTGRENIFLNGTILGMKRAEIAAKFDEIVEFSEIGGFIDTPVKRYSSGMFMRLAFAVAAHLEAEILLIDEVLAVGDLGFQKKCLGKMEGIAKTGRTVLFVSHNLVAMEQLCRHCVYIADGHIKMTGPASEVLRDYSKEFSSNADRNFQPGVLRGDGRVALKSYRITNSRGEEHPLPVTNETLEMHVSMTVQERIARPVCGVTVWNSRGVVMLSATSIEQGHELPPLPEGDVEVTVRLRDLPLLPGDYTASFWIMNPNWHIYAAADAAVCFEIGQGGIYGTQEVDHRWGCVYFPVDYSWNPVAALDNVR